MVDSLHEARTPAGDTLRSELVVLPHRHRRSAARKAQSSICFDAPVFVTTRTRRNVGREDSL
jgi:hypothetical protein